MTIRHRFALTVAAAVSLTVILASVGIYVAVRAKLRGEIDEFLRARVTLIQQRAPEVIPGPLRFGLRSGGGTVRQLGRLPEPEQAERFGGAAGIIQVAFPDGVLGTVPRDGTALPVGERAAEIAAGERGASFSDEEVGGEDLRVLTAPLGGGAVLQAARPLDEVNATLRDLVVILVLVIVAGIGLGAGLGALLSRTSLAPIRRFTERTEAVAGGPDLSQRLPVESDDELGRLALSFNSMLGELERSAEARRQLVSDASHELRTPLTSLRANIELLREERLDAAERRALAADVTEQIDDLNRLVGDVVELARRGEPEESRDDLPLHEVVAESVERARRHWRRVEFELEAEPCVIRGSPERVGRAVYNLLDNAAKWGEGSGAVEVRLRGRELTVRDHGPGFEASDLQHVFDRFYRAPTVRGRPGSGLGLAIVRQVVEEQGGEVSARNAPGGGALLQARFRTDHGEASPGSDDEGLR